MTRPACKKDRRHASALVHASATNATAPITECGVHPSQLHARRAARRGAGRQRHESGRRSLLLRGLHALHVLHWGEPLTGRRCHGRCHARRRLQSSGSGGNTFRAKRRDGKATPTRFALLPRAAASHKHWAAACKRCDAVVFVSTCLRRHAAVRLDGRCRLVREARDTPPRPKRRQPKRRQHARVVPHRDATRRTCTRAHEHNHLSQSECTTNDF